MNQDLHAQVAVNVDTAGGSGCGRPAAVPIGVRAARRADLKTADPSFELGWARVSLAQLRARFVAHGFEAARLPPSTEGCRQLFVSHIVAGDCARNLAAVGCQTAVDDH